jgi:hypothetical protein
MRCHPPKGEELGIAEMVGKQTLALAGRNQIITVDP